MQNDLPKHEHSYFSFYNKFIQILIFGIFKYILKDHIFKFSEQGNDLVIIIIAFFKKYIIYITIVT